MNLVLQLICIILFSALSVAIITSTVEHASSQSPNFSDTTPFDITDELVSASLNQVIDAVNSTAIDSEYISNEINKSISNNNIKIQQYIDKEITSIIRNLTSYTDSKIANISVTFERLNTELNDQQLSISKLENTSNFPTTVKVSDLYRLDTTNTLLLIFVVIVFAFAGFISFIITKLLKGKEIL